jgi:carbonic anhydrase
MVGPGDIFVMRNIANTVPPFELSGRYHERQAVRLSFANLRTFPWIESLVEQGSLRLTGLYFG